MNDVILSLKAAMFDEIMRISNSEQNYNLDDIAMLLASFNNILGSLKNTSQQTPSTTINR